MTQEIPLVTIVTITFNLIKANREKTFRQCLESVHNQTYKNIEHIVIDGGSKDGTIDLIKEYTDKEWIKYNSEPDTGIYDAMNKGIKMAKGKYIAFLNSDDYYHGIDGVYNSVIALEESGADFSYAPVRMINEYGVVNNNHPHVAPKIKNVFFVMPFCHQTMFTKRDVLIKENLFDDNFKSAGDYDLVIRLCLKNYKNIYVKDLFTTFTWGGFSVSNNGLSVEEVASIYYRNYSKICSITKEECGKIYCNQYTNIPPKLAEALRYNNEYFNYKEYIDNNKVINKYKRYLKYFIIKWYQICILAIFSPKKFVRKVQLKTKEKSFYFKESLFSFYRKLPLPVKIIYRYFKSKIYEK